MRAMASEAREPGRIYLTGGASAVLRGWRDSTVDVDLTIMPANDRWSIPTACASYSRR
jgi:hypothetical protein